MKFAAVLRDSVADLPDTQELFQKYKQLKKSLKRIQPAGGERDANCAAVANPVPHSDSDDADAARPSANAFHQDAASAAVVVLDPAQEAEFLRAITADVAQLNDQFIDKEEQHVMKFTQMEETAAAAMAPGASSEVATAAYRAFINFHGELLMLLHWSILAYTSLVKILKKHTKRTGAPLVAPHLENLLAQPFCSVEVTCDMVRQAEQHVAELAARLQVVPPVPAALPTLFPGGSETITSPARAAGPAGRQRREGEPPQTNGSNPAAVTAAATASAASGRRQGSTVAADAEPSPAAAGSTSGGGKRGADEADRDQSGAAQDTEATRRVRAALHVWEQLQANVHTPSTAIALGGAPAQLAVSDMTNSSAA